MISVLVPSRGRPELFERMRRSAADNGCGKHEILLRLDMDDPIHDQYGKKDLAFSVAGYTTGVGACWNELAAKAKGDWLMMGNDDLVFTTTDWDQLLLEKLECAWVDNILVAWCNDGSPNAADHCAFPIVHRKWYETLGYFTPEHFHFLWNDTWIADIGRRLNRLLYIPDILIEHRHFTFKKAEYDDTYKRHRDGLVQHRKRAQDRDIYEQTSKDRERDAAKLRLQMDVAQGGA